MIRILFLSANPNNADTLLAGDELRQIEAALKGSRFEVIAKPAARLEDLPDLLRQSQAAIVHFSGHGSHYGELMFVNEQGESQSAPIPALAKLFELFKGQVRCVILNACYSDEQATAIAEQVECVLGFEGAIRDDAARTFARGFYGALAAGETLVRAKAFGLNEIERRYPEALLPCHLGGQGDAESLRPLDWDDADEANASSASTTYNTAGGPVIGRDVSTGGDFVNRDKIEGDKVEGDKFTGHKTVIQQQIIYQTTPPDRDQLAARHLPPAIRGIFGQYPFNHHFFGRDDELAELHTLLQTQNTVSICPVITGMGGLGKTQLAAHYARRHEMDYPDGIFWVTAADLNAIRGQLADFCVALGLSVADPQRTGDLSEQKITAFKHYLDEHPRALLIFDNVEEPDHLRTRQIGVQMTSMTLGGKLLVTTRRRKVERERFVELPLQRLQPAPARQILLAARDDLRHDPDLNRLCEQFGYLPLMLNLAAAALKKRGGAIAGYLQRLHTLGAEKLHNDVAKVSLDDYHKSLSAVLQEQWAMLQDENARLLFRVAGQLPEAEVIPSARLGLLAGLQDVDVWECPLSDAMEELERASLIERVDTQTIRLHPLVRNFAETLTLVSSRNDFCCQCAQRLAEAYTNCLTGLSLIVRQYQDRSLRQIIEDMIIGLDFGNALISKVSVKDENFAESLEKLQNLTQLLQREILKIELFNPDKDILSFIQQLFFLSNNEDLTWLRECCNQILVKNNQLYICPIWSDYVRPIELKSLLFGSMSWIIDVAVINDGTQVVTPTSNGKIMIWDVDYSSLNRVIDIPKYMIGASHVFNQGKSMLIGTYDGELWKYNLITNECDFVLKDHWGMVNTVVCFDEGTRAISGSADRSVKIWNLQTQMLDFKLTGHTDNINDIAVFDSGERAISASDDNSLIVWNLKMRAAEQTLLGHSARVVKVRILNNDFAISASYDHTVRVWNINTGEVVKLLSNVTATALHVLANNCQVILGTEDGEIMIWDTDKDLILVRYRGHVRYITAFAEFAHASDIISVSEDGTAKIWDLSAKLSEGIENMYLPKHKKIIYKLLVDNSKTFILSKSSDQLIVVREMETGNIVDVIVDCAGGANNCLFLNESSTIVYVTTKNDIKYHSLTSAQSPTIVSNLEVVKELCISRNDKYLAWICNDKLNIFDNGMSSLIWQSHDSERIEKVQPFNDKGLILLGHIEGEADKFLSFFHFGSKEYIGSIKLPPDLGFLSVLAFRDGSYNILQLPDGSYKFSQKELEVSGGRQLLIIASAIYQPLPLEVDQLRIISVTYDHKLLLWEFSDYSPKLISTLVGHKDSIREVRFWDDGNKAVSVSADHTIRLWDLQQFRQITYLTLDTELTAVSVIEQPEYVRLIVGDALGNLYCFKISNPHRE